MKKLLSLLMALTLMLVPFAALAEEGDYEVYLSPDETYGFVYPNSWMLISREIIEEAIEEGYTAGDGGLGDMIEILKPQMEQMDLIMVMNMATSDNLNMVRQDIGQNLSDEDLLKSMEQFKSMWSQLDPNVEFLSGPELSPVGEDGRSYAMVLYSTTDVSGLPINAIQATTCEGSIQYTFTMTMYSTEGDAAYEAIETMETVLSTFTTF